MREERVEKCRIVTPGILDAQDAREPIDVAHRRSRPLGAGNTAGGDQQQREDATARPRARCESRPEWP
jgi:hypothetical protein